MYIALVNIHGLVRSKDIEFGRDADTGGQTRYVVDLARALGEAEGVERVDLITRLINDKTTGPGYAVREEKIGPRARIVRLQAGGQRYLKKERLWNCLDEFADRLVAYLRRQDRLPDALHGHYADGGYVAVRAAELLGLPLVFSAHSLGRNKLAFLASQGVGEDKADERYAIRARIRAEEEVLSRADLVVASTSYERDELYGLYERRSRPRYAVIPPGLDLESFFPYYEYELPGASIPPEQRQAQARMRAELRRFHFSPEKPLILTLCRPDARKNIDLLIQAYGEDKELQSMANLAVFAGIRDDINAMEESERQVLTDVLLAMDRYDLYGKMAIPKNHDPRTDVPELYRLAALSRGAFASASFLETFGLTFIEASAAGLPFVAADRGGPVDIAANLGSGVLTDTQDPAAMAAALKSVLSDQDAWIKRSQDGVNNTRRLYAWRTHVEAYLRELRSLGAGAGPAPARVDAASSRSPIARRLAGARWMLIADIDDTLLGDPAAAAELGAWLESRRDDLIFGVATGRSFESARSALAGGGLPMPDVWIAGVGTSIRYGPDAAPDSGWDAHIGQKWKPEAVAAALARLSFLRIQTEEGSQGRFKLSYYLDGSLAPAAAAAEVHAALAEAKLWYTATFSHGKFLDVLPYRAGKGKALRYLSLKWNVPLDRVVTAGNSGNDRDMLIGSVRGVVVANYEPELEPLRKNPRVRFAAAPYARGVLEGLKAVFDEGA